MDLYSGVDPNTIAPVSIASMQHDRASERHLRHILLADPHYGHVYLMKHDMADCYYYLGLIIKDIPRLAVAFPSEQHQDPRVALTLVLSMGWKNSGHAFCTTTKTIVDIMNTCIINNKQQHLHPLDTIAKTMYHNHEPETITSNPHQKPHNFPEHNTLLYRSSPKRAAYVDV